jgi:hypothetical protein
MEKPPTQNRAAALSSSGREVFLCLDEGELFQLYPFPQYSLHPLAESGLAMHPGQERCARCQLARMEREVCFARFTRMRGPQAESSSASETTSRSMDSCLEMLVLFCFGLVIWANL